MGAGRLDDAVSALRAAILGAPGVLEPGVRQAIADRMPADPRLDGYVASVAGGGSTLTARHTSDLLAAGCSEDEIFEATLSAALGAADRVRAGGLGALRPSPG
ncbi:MAG TPA: hypothetical protein VFW71_15640 [Actinomycetota bacterium]|nr:hypothetical protein [Actinomycetota bacterium]